MDTNFRMAEAWMMKMNSIPYEVNPYFTKPEEIKRLVNKHVKCKKWVNFWMG